MAKKVPLKTVADEVGCSLAVVSAVLNKRGKNAIRVSEKKRQEVVAAARKLGVKVQHTSNRVGIYVWHDESNVPMGYYEALSVLVIQEALNAGLTVETLSDEIVDPRLDAGLDGIISVGHERHFENLGNIPNFPVISINKPMTEHGIHSVSCDHVEQGRLVTAHGIEKGHSRIAYLESRLGSWGYDERVKGYKQALEESGIPYDQALVAQIHGSSIEDILKRWMADDVTLILNFPSIRCLEVIHCLTDTMGLRIGEDVSMISINDLPILQYFSPPQTVIDQPLGDLAKEAVSLMERLIAERGQPSDDDPVQTVCLPPRIIERRSVKDLNKG